MPVAAFGRLLLLASVAIVAGRVMAATASAHDDLSAVAEDAYVYGYPLVLMDQTRRQLTNVPAPGTVAAPINQFSHGDELPNASFRAVVRPNVDTLYSSAFLDLSEQPIVLHVPDTQGRYYMMPMLDAYTNVFASPGKRTTGTGEHDFAIVGPGWSGTLPAGMTRIQAPTNMVWIIGRTEVRGPTDLPNVVALSKRYRLAPLEAYRTAYRPPRNTQYDPKLVTDAKPPDVVAKMNDYDFFTRLAVLMEENPPPARDREALARFAAIGLSPGRFQPSPEAARAMKGTSHRAIARIEPRAAELGRDVNGWHIATNLGSYGTRYLDRATIALDGLGANLPEDAIYPQLGTDAQGKPLSGANDYVMHFPAGATPPVRGFWSITMYDPQGYLVANPIQRFAIGDRDALQRNPDGSIDIHVQAAPPPGGTSNWLPAPRDRFNLTLRMYWPDASALDGSWSPPPLARVRSTEVGKAAP